VRFYIGLVGLVILNIESGPDIGVKMQKKQVEKQKRTEHACSVRFYIGLVGLVIPNIER
jgi:hypothetical protein